MYLLPDAATLEAILAVADQGGMAAAARATGKTQQSISVRVAQAEKALGLRLFARSARGCSPTARGEEVLQILRRYQQASNTCASELARLLNPVLRIAASHTVAEYDLPRWVHGQVRVLQANSAQAQELLFSDAVDLAFVEGNTIRPGLEQQVITSDELCVVVPEDHPWGQSISPEEFAKVPMVMREQGSGTREVLEAAAEALQIGLATPAAEFASLASQARAVLAMGVPGVIPVRTLSPGLRRVQVQGLDLRRDIRAVWKGELRPEAAALLRTATEGSASHLD
ncbi:LysR family transcriptional regulator [Corynebacterium pseudopelargi]|uniref:HTH-type transcriptional regulator CysL n=1 Tax=Corynebacterium pseudopelargi TaxID=2080757 RepID=A0A3G6IWJ4_9CORY|nr:LysR family transcriptional regulator [Corynebacterium pseudopelargi]AZA08334.1 HTH-type transcriptional regulator CysL [Corynebacterium pseudopelargi]